MDTKQKILYDRGSKGLQPLNEGMHVWVQNPETKKWDVTAKIISRVRKRIYKLEMSNLKVTHRNRKWIRRCQTSPDVGINQQNKQNDFTEMGFFFDKVLKSKRNKKHDS